MTAPPSQPPPPQTSQPFRQLNAAETDALLAQRLQEQEDAKLAQQTQADAEIAAKLQYNDQSAPAENEPQVRPPMDVHREERMVEPYYPQPQQSRDPRQPLLPTHNAGPNRSSDCCMCLKTDDDTSKTCGIKTTAVVFGVAGLLTVGIVIGLIILT